jgi:hypothetical protein
MLYNFEATKDYCTSLIDIETLLEFAKGEEEQGNHPNRMLFLKLSVVSMVTKFQVYVEKVLSEFLFLIRGSKKKNKELSLHAILNSIKLISNDYALLKKLENPSEYSNSKFTEINQHVAILNKHCDIEHSICENFYLQTKFPIGKTGVNELLGLFRQFEGKENIFEEHSIDIEKLNGILNIRHNIVHQDVNPSPLTEVLIQDYRKYFQNLVYYIDNYLAKLYH